MTSPRELPADVAHVQDMRDFAAYLEIMADDFDADRADWERQRREGKQLVDGHWSSMYVGDFLRTWAAWLADGCLREGGPFKDDVDSLT